MSDLKKYMGPETLNAIYCLSCNRSLWADNDEMPSSFLHQIIQKEEKKRAGRTRATTKRNP